MKPKKASDVDTSTPDEGVHSGLVRAGDIELADPGDEERVRIAAHRAVSQKKTRQRAIRTASKSTGTGDLFERLSRKAEGELR